MEKIVKLTKEELVILDKAMAMYCKYAAEYQNDGDYKKSAELYNKLQAIRVKNFGSFWE